MSEEAKVGMQGFAPEVQISSGEWAGMAPKEQRRIRERNRRWRLSESLEKLKAKVEAGHPNAEAYKVRIADIAEELGLTQKGGG